VDRAKLNWLIVEFRPLLGRVGTGCAVGSVSGGHTVTPHGVRGTILIHPATVRSSHVAEATKEVP
jgi:hypothetical protein